jgi:hypothetical protein
VNQSLIALELDAVMPAVIESGLLVSLFTAQAPDTALGTTGAPSGAYVNVVGLVNIRCTSPPLSESKIVAGEMKAIIDIVSTEFHHVLLEAWLPALDEGWRNGWRCTIDGFLFDISGVESDSQMKMTRVAVKLVTS